MPPPAWDVTHSAGRQRRYSPILLLSLLITRRLTRQRKRYLLSARVAESKNRQARLSGQSYSATLKFQAACSGGT